MARDGDGKRATARAVGLEVSRERYLRTTDRLRRCERTTRLAGWLGPVAGVLPGDARRRVEVASADAREVLGKLWTAGERYRLVAERLDGAVDPADGVDPDAFDDLQRRLAETPERFDAGDHGAVADTLAEARKTMRRLLDARYDDVGALARFDPDRLRAAAEDAAEAVDTGRRERRGERETGQEAGEDLVTPVGNSDQIRPEALEDENVGPDAIADLADEEEAVDPDDLAAMFGIAPGDESNTVDGADGEGVTVDGETAGDDTERDDVEETVGSGVEVDVGGDDRGESVTDAVDVADRETTVRDPAVNDSDGENPDAEDGGPERDS